MRAGRGLVLSNQESQRGANFHQLEVAFRHQIGALSLDISFKLTQPWSVLFAPSGAGKTTVLRVIAGLLVPQHGRIVSRVYPESNVDREFVLTDTADGVFVPPHKRVIRMVSQQGALFPHLNVLQNMKYRMPSMVRDESEAKAKEEAIAGILALCRITHLAEKMPRQLSGGERQRVALARSIAAGTGRVLLLDEPFTGLDLGLRDSLVADLRAWLAQRRTPVLQVTHDIGEAFATNAEVITLDDGRVSAQGPATEVLAAERERLLEQLNAAKKSPA